MISELPTEASVYFPRGSALAALKSKVDEWLLDGPAGTGKSRVCLEKLNALAEKYAGCRLAIVRKARAALTETALVTFEDHVKPRCDTTNQKRRVRQSYEYPNGSEIIIAGIDNPIKLMSAEFDAIYCLAGDTLVDSPSRIERGYKRPYSGQIITIKTASGYELTGTPNHPILTNTGWVALGELYEGCYVFSRLEAKQGSSRSLGIGPHVEDGPSTIADVVSALAQARSGGGRTKRVKTVPVNFHGDGGNSYVDVVTPALLLNDGNESLSSQHLLQLESQWRDLQDALTVDLCSEEQCAGCGNPAFICRSNLFAEGAHALPVPFGIDPRDSASSRRLRESTFPFGINVPDVAQSLAFAGGAGLKAEPFHLSFESGDTNPQAFGDSHQSSLPREVTLDRVVEFVRGEAPSGWHVYNLQTVDSWYYANNIVSHNCQEATELSVNDWEFLSTRLRNGVIPYQQLFGDCNPGPPSHWLNKRMDAGLTKRILSRHEENPRLYTAKGELTPFGSSYMARLDKLTGARKQRLRYGKWVASEGVVFENYDAAVHLIDPFVIPPNWRRFRVVDFGFTHPFVCQWYTLDPDGRMYRYREIYKTKRTVKEHAAQIKALSEGERYEAFITDHDAEDRATLEHELGVKTKAAQKAVTTGIQAVLDRLAPADDGRPRLYLMRDALVERDPLLIDETTDLSLGPVCTEEEIDGYVWAKGAGGETLKEQPVKEGDHGCDCLRYAAMYLLEPISTRHIPRSTQRTTAR